MIASFFHIIFADIAERITYFIEEVYNKKSLNTSPEKFEYIFKNTTKLFIIFII
jgi:hypothetical protein